MNSIQPSSCLALLMSLMLVGCMQAEMDKSGLSETRMPAAKMAVDGAPAMNQPAGGDAVDAPEGQADLSLERKIVYTATVEIVVEDFDAVEKDLQELIKQYEGYIAASNTQVAARDRREGTWTIRVPVKCFHAFLDDAKKLGELRSTGIDSQDRTEEYYDVQAALENKRKTLDRFKKLAEQHDADLQHIREVEKDIERVQGEIDRLTGRIRLLDNLTSLTTVTLTAVEIKDYVPPEAPTFGTEISRSFSQSISSLKFTGRQFAIFIVAAAPWLPILLIVAVILRYVLRFTWRRLRRDETGVSSHA